MLSISRAIGPVLAASLLAGSVAQASIMDPIAWYYDDTNAGWTCRSMIDLDQRRETNKFTVGLPGNGEKHCGPTATTNLLAWLANHGDTGLAPGPGDWQSEDFYDAATAFIEDIGVDQNCCGVGASDVHDSLVDRLNPEMYKVFTRVRDDDESPGFQSMLDASLAGGMTIFAYGKYEDTGEVAKDGIPIRTRVGGHVVTLQDIRINGEDRRIRARNPWTGTSDDHFRQSVFSSREYFPVQNTFYRRVNSGALRGPYTLSQLLYAGQSDTVKHLDWTSTVYPAWGLTIINYELSMVFANLDNDEPEAISIPTDSEMPIYDCELVEATRWLWFLQKAGEHAALKRMHMPTGELKTFDTLGLQYPREMVMDDRGSMWVVDGRKMVRLDALDTNPHIGFEEEIPAYIHSLTWDPSSRALIALNEDSSEVVIMKLIEYGFIMEHLPIPGSVDISSKARIGITDGGMPWWIADPDSGLWFMTNDPEMPIQQLEHPDIKKPVDVEVTDGGTLLVSDTGVWKAFSKEARNQWTRNGDHFLDGQPAGSRIAVSHSTSNWDPEYHTDPSWKIMSPPEDGGEIVDCPADVNLDQTVDVKDLLRLLSDWNDTASPADLNSDGMVNILDLLVVLNGWGNCQG